MRKIMLFLAILFICVSPLRAQEVLSEFSDKTLPVLNDQLSKSQREVARLGDNLTNLDTFYLAYSSSTTGHDHDGSDSKTIPLTTLGTGTPGATNYLRGDGSWQVITVPTVKTILAGSFGISTGSNIYHTFGGNIADSDVTKVRTYIPMAGTLKNLYVFSDSGTITWVIYKNQSATTLTCTTNSGVDGGLGSDTTNTVSVSAGDYISIRASTNATNSTASVEFDPS
jgi:hypothetical protein